MIMAYAHLDAAKVIFDSPSAEPAVLPHATAARRLSHVPETLRLAAQRERRELSFLSNAAADSTSPSLRILGELTGLEPFHPLQRPGYFWRQ